MKFLFLILFIASCTHGHRSVPEQAKGTFSYTDISGTYSLLRESKSVDKKIVTRNQLITTAGSSSKILEKSITVSRLGSIKSGKTRVVTVRPEASEFVVWLEGKKYQSNLQLDPKTRSMRMKLESPEAKWNGESEIQFPKGKYFCFFNQIPECLYHNFFLEQASTSKPKKFDFVVIWESFPFIQDQLSNVGKKLFAEASVKFDGEIKNNFRYIVEVEGQIILYHFSKSFDFVKMIWIAQGITVVPPEEASTNDDDE